jgi:quinol monooxygenase YgiN
MHFRSDLVADFLDLFEKNCEAIRNVAGCRHLSLLEEVKGSGIFFTYSWWDGPEYLELYRQSDLFQQIWSKTKTMFAAKPEAWSLIENKKLA